LLLTILNVHSILFERKLIRSRKSKKGVRHNGQEKKDKRTNNDRNITQTTKDRATRTPLETGGDLRYSGMVSGRVYAR